ncbi:MAG: ethanolamine utilization cob(I)yrinic acid a,c-diamide adenosyltransferase EutT [Deltaproteobacteria bacterium]|jgi:ethanolamine utilization cobalamin adenosyltransferase|nr:ethanolamine utilization cob(I)yrinic acid a,c-diamide adenosyltransferase EutT [Deltaproteobacteria bacterium]
MGTYVTETWLRERFSLGHGAEIRLPADARLTPAARTLLRERRIEVKYADEAGRIFLDATPDAQEPELKRVHPLTGDARQHTSACLMCGRPLRKKPDTLTHLDAHSLTAKNDPRLKLRGKLDSAIAHAVLLQAEFDPQGSHPALAQWLADIRSALGNALKAEVAGTAMPPIAMGDMDAEKIHAVSHKPLQHLGHDHLLPEAGQGARVARLNLLRAQIREAELYAADVYITRDFTVTRPDIMQGLNRLSSAVYVLMLLTYLAEQGKTVAPCP